MQLFETVTVNGIEMETLTEHGAQAAERAGLTVDVDAYGCAFAHVSNERLEEVIRDSDDTSFAELCGRALSGDDEARSKCVRVLLEPNLCHGDYYPTYQIHDELDAATAAWLTEQSGEGPLRLIDVTDVCATYKVRAELRDSHGFSRGWVQPDGSYRLG